MDWLYLGITLMVVCLLIVGVTRYRTKQSARDRENMYKLQEHVRLLSEWLIAKEEGRCLAELLKNYEAKNVAIYGLAQLGELLVYELHDTDIRIIYGIDRNDDDVFGFPVYSPDDDLPPVDMIIVTAFTYYEEIKRNLSGKVTAPLVPLNDLIEEM